MKVIILLLMSIFILSCADDTEKINNGEIYNSYNYKAEEDKSQADTIINHDDDYSFHEGYVSTTDNINIYYRLYHKEMNKGLIVLSHREDSSLEEWDILMDIFLETDYDIISYDLRGFGKSRFSGARDIHKMQEDLKLIVHFAQLSNENDFKNIVFIGNGLGGNISLYSSADYCNTGSSFIVISPDMLSEEMSVAEFNKYCDGSRYLFLYSRKDFYGLNEQLYIFNYDNLKTMVDSTENYSGINILLNNSLFIKEIKNIINF